MRAIAKVNSGFAQDAFWWLIVHGVLIYDQIETFQDGGNGWNSNLPLVTLSDRGAALLNGLRDPI
jgi:hypothetical protein